MAAPSVTVNPPTGGPFAPGSTVTFTWTVTDPDNRTITGAWAGEDQDGNAVSGTVTIQVADQFTMTSFTLGGANLTINNAARTATGTVPAA